MEKNEEDYQQRMSDEQGQVGHISAWEEPDASLPKVPRPVKSNKTMKLNEINPKRSFRLVNDWRVYCIKTPATTEDTIPQAGYILTYPDDIHVIAGWWPNDTEVIPVDDISRQILTDGGIHEDIVTSIPVFGEIEKSLSEIVLENMGKDAEEVISHMWNATGKGNGIIDRVVTDAPVPVDVYNTLEEIAEELRQQVMWKYNPDIWNIMHKLRRTIDTGKYLQDGTE